MKFSELHTSRIHGLCTIKNPRCLIVDGRVSVVKFQNSRSTWVVGVCWGGEGGGLLPETVSPVTPISSSVLSRLTTMSSTTCSILWMVSSGRDFTSTRSVTIKQKTHYKGTCRQQHLKITLPVNNTTSK